jgi:hypothetical protein
METRAENTGCRTGLWRIGSLIGLLALAVFTIALLWFYVSGLYVGGINGTVGIVENIDAPRESWRIVPAANVDVLILWRAEEMNLAHPRSPCVRTVLMRTNAHGEYSTGGWWLAPAWPPRIDAYGYVHVSSPGHLPIVDRSRLAPNPSYTHILGPPAINPWTGLVLPDESPLRPTQDRDCPPVERL